MERLGQRVDGIAWRGVLLDDKPLATRLLSGFNDAREVEVSRTDFAEGGVVFVIDDEILQVDQREAASEALAPIDGIAPAVLHPVGVGFALQMRSLGKNPLEDRAALPFPEFIVMVVVAEGHLVGGENGCRFFQARYEALDAVAITEIDSGWVRVGGEAAAQLLEALDDGLGVVQDFIARLVRGTADEALAVEDAEEFVFGNGTHSAHLNGLIAHGAHAA